jgi:hypothetical protein
MISKILGIYFVSRVTALKDVATKITAPTATTGVASYDC